jgi:hypothetical protein
MSKQAAKEGEKRPLPGSYSEMYPNRFLKADMLKGKRVTLTIRSIVGEGLMSDDGGANLEWVVSFTERPLEFVMNKTNAFCLYRMFGGDPHSWIGRRVTLFPTTVQAFGQKQDCIRIWGSPDLEDDLPITVPQGRKKAWETVMHKVADKQPINGHGAPQAPAGVDPRIMAGLKMLPDDVAAEFLNKHQGADQEQTLRDLNALTGTV